MSAAATSAPGSGRQVAKRRRKSRAPKFSYDALKGLQRVWALTGGQCGKCLAVSTQLNLDLLRARAKLAFGADRYSESVRAELLSWRTDTCPWGAPRFARCDPPFKPWFLRRNEAIQDVTHPSQPAQF